MTDTMPRVAWARFQALLRSEGYTLATTLPEPGVCPDCNQRGLQREVWQKGGSVIGQPYRRAFVHCPQARCDSWQEVRG